MEWGTDSAKTMAQINNAIGIGEKFNNMKTPNAMDRLQEIGQIVSAIVAMCA